MRLGYSGTGRGDCPTHLPWQWICLRCCARWSPRPLQWKVNKTHGPDLFVEVEPVPPASGGCSPLLGSAASGGEMRDCTHVDRSRSPRFSRFFWPCHSALLLLLNTNNLLYQVRSDLLSSLAPSESFQLINNRVVLYYLVLQKTGLKSESKSAGSIIKSAYSLVCLNYAHASLSLSSSRGSLRLPSSATWMWTRSGATSSSYLLD